MGEARMTFLYLALSFNTLLTAAALALGLRSWIRLNRMKKGMYLLAKKYYEGEQKSGIKSWFLNKDGKLVPFDKLEPESRVLLMGVGMSFGDIHELYMDFGRKAPQ